MTVDAHAHVIVPELTREAAPAESWRPRVYRDEGRQMIEFEGRRIPSAVREIVSLEGILQAQTAAGIDRTVLAPWVNLLRYDAPVEEGLRIARVQNEALAGLAAAHPERISVLGSVPLQAPEIAGRELEAVMRLPGAGGVEIAAAVRGAYLGAEQFLPFWEAAEASGALVFIHPTTRGFGLPVLDEYYLWNTVGNPLETTITAAHMVMAGVLERHPRLKVLLAHGGGAILQLRGRLRHAHGFQGQARSRLRESPESSLRRFYVDTVTHDPAVLRSIVEFLGADHVLLGSDYPFDMGVERPVEIVEALRLPPDPARGILGGNAAKLLGVSA